jgi:hypothetical protein
LSNLSISENLADRRKHIFETLHECLGLSSLCEGNDSCKYDDSDEYEPQDEIGEVALSLNDVGDDAED